MLTLASLWLPIVLAAVAVFVVTSLIHMVFRWHASDYRKLSNEDEVREAINRGNPTPGQYQLPHCVDGKSMQTPEMQQRMVVGPVGLIALRPKGMPSLGKLLGQWFVLTLVVALLTAALASTVIGKGADAHVVFHFFALISFLAYGTGSVVTGIWKAQTWKSVALDLLDALLYALATAAVFVWLWPQ